MKAYIVRRAPEPYDPAAARHQSNISSYALLLCCSRIDFRMIPTCRDRGEMR